MTEKVKKANFRLVRTLASAAVSVMALSTLPVGAQGTSGSSSGATGATGATGTTGATGAARAMGGAGDGATVSQADSKLMAELAQANIAEVETGQMALEKTQNDTVKKFAQKMVDDHTAALTELQTLAQTKGVKLPDGPNAKHTAMAAALKLTSGATFDTQYMKSAGVASHQQTVELLKKIQKNGKDAEFKAMASKKLPAVQAHLKMAEQGLTSVSAKK